MVYRQFLQTLTSGWAYQIEKLVVGWLVGWLVGFKAYQPFSDHLMPLLM